MDKLQFKLPNVICVVGHLTWQLSCKKYLLKAGIHFPPNFTFEQVLCQPKIEISFQESNLTILQG